MPSDIDVYPRPVEPGEPTPPVSEGPVPPASSVADELDESDTPPDAPTTDPEVASASSDDLTASLVHARPDPLLGAFVTEGPADETGTDAVPSPTEDVQGHGPHPGSRADAMLALGSLRVGDDVTSPGPGESGTSSDALAGIALDTSAPAQSAPETPAAVKDEEDDEDDEDDDDLPPARGSSIGMMLLASYASAVTLGLIWVLWTGRRLREAPEPDDPPSASRVDSGPHAPTPIPAEHLTTLGKTVRLGQIEATPLSVTSGPVTLERNFEGHQIRTGGENALKLRLKLRNASSEAVIAPLDEAFLRDRPKADPDSFIELPEGAGTIGQFPLAVESEWSIVGQQFRELKPGETVETLIVSAPDALAKKAPEMTWRVRLRTDLNHTDDLGVRFGESDIKPGR